MSTTNPDEIAKTIRHRLMPLAVPVAIIGVLIAPAMFLINVSTGDRDANATLIFLTFLIVSVGAGLFGYYVIRPTAWILAAYIAQYIGGLLLVISSAVPLEDGDSVIHAGLWLVAPPYLFAVFALVMWGLRKTAMLATRERGVDTTATIESIGVDGQVNYIQHQRMTLSFTDTNGTKRYFRTGITGGFYDIGDTIPIRYDPEHPESKRSIIVGGQPYVSKDQQP
jgi:hypothetical protein